MSKQIAFVLGALGIAAVTIASFAPGTVSAQTNAIHACVMNATGNLRIVAVGEACRPRESRLSWNAQGVMGPQGPAGPQGPQGLAGPSDIYFAKSVSPATKILDNVWTDLVSFTLPPGQYLLTANTVFANSTLANGQYVAQRITCGLGPVSETLAPLKTTVLQSPIEWAVFIGGEFRRQITGTEQPEYDFTFQRKFTNAGASPIAIVFRCFAFHNVGELRTSDVFVFTSTISAIKTGTLHE